MKQQKTRKNEIIIYKTSKDDVRLEVRFEGETLWLRQNEIARLFEKDRFVITRHINKIFSDKEVDKKSNVHFMHIPFIDGNKRIVSFLFVYFLDRNNFLFKNNGEGKINDNALTALSLLIAISDPKGKGKLIRITMNLLTE